MLLGWNKNEDFFDKFWRTSDLFEWYCETIDIDLMKILIRLTNVLLEWTSDEKQVSAIIDNYFFKDANNCNNM